jgi:hypothetical protein
MTLLPWPQRKTQIAIEDAQMRATVDHAMQVMERHRGLDWQFGYNAGYEHGFLLGVGLTMGVGLAVWVWLWVSVAVQ